MIIYIITVNPIDILRHRLIINNTSLVVSVRILINVVQLTTEAQMFKVVFCNALSHCLLHVDYSHIVTTTLTGILATTRDLDCVNRVLISIFNSCTKLISLIIIFTDSSIAINKSCFHLELELVEIHQYLKI